MILTGHHQNRTCPNTKLSIFYVGTRCDTESAADDDVLQELCAGMDVPSPNADYGPIKLGARYWARRAMLPRVENKKHGE